MSGSPSSIAAFEQDPSPQGRLVRAALELVDRIGIDRVSVSAVLAESGVARATVYAHFGDISGVIASAWSALGEEWLRWLLTDPDPDAPVTRRGSAMAQILVSAHRNPVLREVVGPDVERVWANLDRTEPIAELRAVWLMALRIGSMLCAPAVPDVLRLTPLIPLAAEIPSDVDVRYGLAGSPILNTQLEELASPFEAEPDPITRNIMQAEVKVVAASGVAAASMLRICRTARITTGAATPRFRTLRSLHEFAFDASLREVVRQNNAGVRELPEELRTIDANALYISAALNDDRREWRRYRQEFHLASMSDPLLAESMAVSFAEAGETFEESVRVVGADPVIEDLAVTFNHITGAGFGVVHELGLPATELDHRLMVRWLVEAISGQVPAGATLPGAPSAVVGSN